MRIHDLIREYSFVTQEDEGTDVFMFRVKLSRDLTDEEIEEFKNLIEKYEGDFTEVDLFDGNEHSYIEVGAWIGDQGLALSLMGIGKLLGWWNIMHPGFLPISKDLQTQMAGAGYVSIVPLKEEVEEDEESLSFKHDLSYDMMT